MSDALNDIISSLQDKKTSDTFYKNVKIQINETKVFEEMREGLDSLFNYFKQFLEMENSSNILLVGRVQAGKTYGFLSLVANSFDVDSNIAIILTGIDKTLKSQTVDERIYPLFKGNGNVKTFAFSSIKDMKNSSKEIISCLNSGQKIIFTSLKNIAWLKELNNQIKLWDKSKITNPIIIDDEGDQASQNVHKNKNDGETSAIFSEITNLIAEFKKSIFISVTATPYAHILIDSSSEIKPDYSISLFPGEGYFGFEDTIANNKIIKLIKEEDRETIKQSSMPLSLKNALVDFIFSGSLLYDHDDTFAKMLINIERETKAHESLKSLLRYFIDEELETFIFYSEYSKTHLSNLEKKLIIKNKEEKKYDDTEIRDLMEQIVDNFKTTYDIKIINQKSNSNLKNDNNQKYEIYIGSDLLQRGVTINNLIVSYVARRAKGTSNADTILQMARWFGYRNKIKDLMSVYLLEQLYSDFIWIEGLDSYVRDTLYEYQLKNKSIKNLERKIKVTPETSEKLSNIKLRAVRTSVAKQHITSSNKRRKSLIHYYDKVSNECDDEQTYLKTINELFRKGWEKEQEVSSKINIKFRNYPILIFNSFEDLGIINFDKIKLLLIKYQGYTNEKIAIIENDLKTGKKKFVLAWMSKQFIDQNDKNQLFDAISRRNYDFNEKRISTIPLGDLNNYTSEKHWSNLNNSYFFFNMYKIQLNDPNRPEDKTIILKAITSSEYKPNNEFFTIEVID